MLHICGKSARMRNMKIANFLVGAACAVVLSGCWTVSETEYPQGAIRKLPQGKTMKVSVIGFKTGLYEYTPTPGHEAMLTNLDDCVDGPYAKANVVTNTYAGLLSVPANRMIARAEIGLERKGYTIVKVNPQYVVEVNFAGPFPRDYTVLKQVGLAICTLFTMEKETAKWTARLNVYDRATNKVVFTRDYTQEYEVSVWGPIPVASPACEPKITEHAANNWAVTALSDRAIDDASDFLFGKVR